MDKHPQNWFFWLNDYGPAVAVIVTVVFAVIGAGWALFTWQKSKAGVDSSTQRKSKASIDISGQVSIGGDVTQVGGDMIITGDPADQKTIRNLNSLVDYFRAELDQRDIELADKEALIAQLKATLELAQKIAAGGDNKLASRARALLADLGPGSLGAALLPDLRALIQDYEQGPIKDLVQLHMGEGALTFYGDPQASLAAYRRAHALDPENIDAINFIGVLELRFGNLKAAEDAFCQVLDLGRTQDDQEAIAVAYGNLGNIVGTLGDLEAAADLYTQALARLEDMGKKVGIAVIYGNLGNVALEQDDLEMAVDYYNQALALNKKLGRKEGMAANYGNLGLVAKEQGDIDAAGDYLNQALDLHEELGSKEGMALNYAGLGAVAVVRGDLLEARQFWVQARGLYAEMGVQPEVAQFDEWLADLEPPAEP
ncbi:MAG: tetratricopeptide repeat protein [Planktomarina sp.]|nr:tetratricopeptide repeat protein [Planktomarina sp.]